MLNGDLRIDGSPPSWRAYRHELYAFREVAWMLIRRDLIVRFRQTYFGLAWLLFKPLMLMLAMTFAFGFLAGFDNTYLVPYPLVIFCGVIPWYFFSNALPDSMNSLVGHMHIIQKTYFPRAIIPLAVIVVDAFEFVIAWLLFVLGCIWFNYRPGWQCLFFPLFCIELFMLCTAMGVFLAVVNVRFRDLSNLVPFLLTIGFFVTPVGYPLSRIPEHWQTLYALNPLVGIIEGLRWSLLEGFNGFPMVPVVLSVFSTLVIGVLAVRQMLAVDPFLVDIA